MAFIQWSENMSVGNHIIDQQHKNLVKMVNTVYDAMGQGKGDEVLKPILKALVDYTKSHFSHEEQFMKQIGYPNLVQHQQIHQAFTQKVQDVYAKVTAGQHVSSVSLAGFLKDWLVSHIMSEDKKYAMVAAQ